MMNGVHEEEKRIRDSVNADRIEWKKRTFAPTPSKIGQRQEDDDGTTILSQKLCFIK